MASYDWNLNHNRLKRGASKQSALPPTPAQTNLDKEGIRDFFLYALFARIANRDNSTHEFCTRYNSNTNSIELEIDDETLQFLEQVTQGTNFKRYLSWLFQSSGGGGTPGITDDETLQGDGTSSDPFRIKEVSTDNTINGTGTPNDPLTVAGGLGDGATPDDETLEGDGTATSPLKIKQVFTDGTIDGNGTPGDPLSVPPVEFIIDDETIEGSSSATDPLRIKKVFTDDTMDGSGTPDNPLSVPPIIFNEDDFEGDGTDSSPLSVVPTVYDEDTITGEGTPTSPITAPFNFSITDIESEDIIRVPAKHQMVFGGDIEINGELILDGSIYEVE